jgi:hypothetical protein
METKSTVYLVRKEGETDTPFFIYSQAVEYAEAFGGEIVKVVTTVKEYYELNREYGLWTTIREKQSV